jgi:hypothetical protein
MKTSFTLTLLLIFLMTQAQNSSMQYGFLPSATMSYKLNSDWQVVTKIETDHVVNPAEFRELTYISNFTDEINFQIYLSYKLNPFWKMAGGYQLGYVSEGGPNHQATQQLSYASGSEIGRLGHRLRSDQRFFENELTSVRVRYRISYELPLNGQSLDAREFYLIGKNEPFIQFYRNIDRFENRLNVSAGYVFSMKSKLELGAEYRFTKFYQMEQTRHVLFIKLDWVVRIN